MKKMNRLFSCSWMLLVIALLMSGCKTKYVPVETIKTEYVVRTDTFIQKDSYAVYDSVYIHEKGDTVWFEKWHTQYVDRWNERIKTDTLIRVDTLRLPYPVERELSKWEQVKMDYGAVAIGVSIAAIAAAVVFIVIRIRRKIPV